MKNIIFIIIGILLFIGCDDTTSPNNSLLYLTMNPPVTTTKIFTTSQAETGNKHYVENETLQLSAMDGIICIEADGDIDYKSPIVLMDETGKEYNASIAYSIHSYRIITLNGSWSRFKKLYLFGTISGLNGGTVEIKLTTINIIDDFMF